MSHSNMGHWMHRLYTALVVFNFLEAGFLLAFTCIPDERGSNAGYMGGENDKTLSNYVSDSEVRGIQFAATFFSLLISILGMFTVIRIANGRWLPTEPRLTLDS